MPYARICEIWCVARCQYVVGSVVPTVVGWYWVWCPSVVYSRHAVCALSCLSVGLLNAFRLYSRVPVYRTIYEPACSKYVTLSACLPYARTYLYEALLF